MTEPLNEALLANELEEIPIIVEREFRIQCSIRGFHIYKWKRWNPEVGSILTTIPETRPGALVEDRYAIAIQHDKETIGHVPKILSKYTFFFLKNGGTLAVKVTGERQYSYDLEQGGLELPAEYCFLTSNQSLLDKMAQTAVTEVNKYNEIRKSMKEKSVKKKEINKNK